VGLIFKCVRPAVKNLLLHLVYLFHSFVHHLTN
jgi:hypothetical protein